MIAINELTSRALEMNPNNVDALFLVTYLKQLLEKS